jgi:hypothetical protein
MAKNSIRDYDATSGNNTDVQSVDISEGCAASGINNALREIMTDLKNVSTGAVALETPAADQLNVDNLRLDGNTISSTDTNGDITIDPDGTGAIELYQNNTKRIETSSTGVDVTGLVKTSNAYQVWLGANVLGSNGGLTSIGSNPIVIGTDGSERLRVDSSGNVHVGKTTTGISTAGLSLRGDADVAQFTRDGGEPIELNRLTSDGPLIIFYKDSTQVGNIGSSSTSGKVFITGGNVGITFTSNGRGHPTNSSGVGLDNSMDWGQAEFRFDDIFATNGTIQTSDQNEKQDIASLTTAEMTAAKAISKLFKTFKWKDKVAAKGDAARTHSGVIAQEVQTAMTDAGLDASKYAFWCSDTWWEADGDTYHTAEEAPEGATQRTRLGVRYPELLAFVGAATEQRLGDIETRLTALENA